MNWLRTTKALRAWRREPRLIALILCLSGWVMAISCLSKWCSLPTLIRFVEPRTFHSVWTGVEPEKIVALVDRLLNLNVLGLTPTCWKRALILHRYLALQGTPTRLVFGVRQGAGTLLDGHAWLESQGKVLYEHEKPAYVKTIVW